MAGHPDAGEDIGLGADEPALLAPLEKRGEVVRDARLGDEVLLVGLGLLLLEVEEQLTRDDDDVSGSNVVHTQRLEIGELLDDQSLGGWGRLHRG